MGDLQILLYGSLNSSQKRNFQEGLQQWKALYLTKNRNISQTARWFKREYAAALAHRNHYCRLYQREWCSRSLAPLRNTHYHCKIVSYPQAVHAKVDNKKMDLTGFGKLKTLYSVRANRLCRPLQIASSDKFNFLVMNFASNCRWDDKKHPLPDFPTSSSISFIFIWYFISVFF